MYDTIMKICLFELLKQESIILKNSSGFTERKRIKKQEINSPAFYFTNNNILQYLYSITLCCNY